MKLLVNDNGALQLVYTGAKASKNETVIPSGKLHRLNNNKGLRIFLTQGGSSDILLSEVTETQLGDSGTPVAFSGTLSDLEAFINTNFFFDLGGAVLTMGRYQATTTTISGDNMTVYEIDTSLNQVIWVKARSLSGLTSVAGGQTLNAARMFTVNATTVTPSASTAPDPNMTNGPFGGSTMGITLSGSNITINLTNGTNNANWDVYYEVQTLML